MISVMKSCLSSLNFEIIIWINSEFCSPSSALDVPDLVSQRRSETPSNEASERIKFITTVNFFNIFGISFWRQIFYSRECHTANATVGDLSNTRVLLLVDKTYTDENNHLLGIYTVVRQVTLRPKRIIHMFVT